MSSAIYDPASWSRFQFGFTRTYRYLFPQLTMGLAWFIVYWEWKALRTGDKKYDRAPVAWYGPIVMNTQAQLQKAFEELRESTFLNRTWL